MSSDSTNERILNTATAVAAGFAAVTVWTHLCQVTGITFSTYSLVGLVTMVLVTLGVGWHGRPGANLPGGPTLALVGLAVIAAGLCLFGYRPDLDDVNYVPNIVHYLA